MNRFVGQVGTVFRKEMLDAVRDRRSLGSALIFPLFAPVMIAVLFGTIAARERDAREVEFPIQGGELAPELVAWIERAGHDVVPTEGDLVDLVRSGELPVAIRIDSLYQEDFARGVPAKVHLIVDNSKSENGAQVRRVRQVISGYASQIGTLRLMARGVAPESTRPVTIREIDLATAQQRSAVFLSFIPLFIIMAAFISGMNVAIDTTAGERERGSLEPLLVNPVPRTEIVLGKWLATVVFASVGIILVLFATLLVVGRLPLEDLGARLNIGPTDLLGILAGTVPLAFMASGLQLVVSTFARSFKEAQTYINLLIFLPMIPGFIASVSSLPTDSWVVAVPALGQQVLLTEVLGGTNPGLAPFLLAGSTSMLIGLVSVMITARLFQNEKLVLGNQ
ncbi:MAG: ABC transporter permease [Longimicrobiales bacterium]